MHAVIRTPTVAAGWKGVRSDSGARSPFYGDVQRRHQDWLLRRAEEIRSGTNDGDGDGGGGSGEEAVSVGEKAGDTVEGKTRTDQEAQEGVQASATVEHGEEGDREGDGGQVVATRYEGGYAETVDSEDWTNTGAGAGPGKDLSAESDKAENAGQDIPDSIGAAVSGGGDSNPAPGTKRHLRRHQQEEPQGRQRQRRRRQAGREAASLASDDGEESLAEEGKASATAAATTAETTPRRRTSAVGWGWGWSGDAAESDTAIKNKERIRRLERGAELWGGTYAPPIESQRRQGLIDKWSDEQQGAQRILYVITSFDRGERLGRDYKQIDKLDYILMMMDEMREACEVGHCHVGVAGKGVTDFRALVLLTRSPRCFASSSIDSVLPCAPPLHTLANGAAAKQLGFWPQIHLIAAWDPSKVTALMEERLFCQRTGKHVLLSYEEHPPSVRNNLAIKVSPLCRERAGIRGFRAVMAKECGRGLGSCSPFRAATTVFRSSFTK